MLDLEEFVIWHGLCLEICLHFLANFGVPLFFLPPRVCLKVERHCHYSVLPHVFLAACVTVGTFVASFKLCLVEASGFKACFPHVFKLLLILDQSLSPEGAIRVGQFKLVKGGLIALFSCWQGTLFLEDLFIEWQGFEKSLSCREVVLCYLSSLAESHAIPELNSLVNLEVWGDRTSQLPWLAAVLWFLVWP